jgi:hypothetical protein
MVIAGIDAGAAMGAAYAIFLGLTALALELLARQSHRRAEQFHLFGFRYDAGLDAWHCPTGKRLERTEMRRDQRSIVYRAPAHHCNCCHRKAECTDSDAGRTIEHRLDSWLDSEVRRFHVGISLALLLLAALIVGIEFVMYRQMDDRAVLSVALIAVAIPGVRLGLPFFSRSDRSRPESAPPMSLSESMRESKAEANEESKKNGIGQFSLTESMNVQGSRVGSERPNASSHENWHEADKRQSWHKAGPRTDDE